MAVKDNRSWVSLNRDLGNRQIWVISISLLPPNSDHVMRLPLYNSHIITHNLLDGSTYLQTEQL